MIPGNRPEDRDWDFLLDWLGSLSLTAGQVRNAVLDYMDKHGLKYVAGDMPVFSEDAPDIVPTDEGCVK